MFLLALEHLMKLRIHGCPTCGNLRLETTNLFREMTELSKKLALFICTLLTPGDFSHI